MTDPSKGRISDENLAFGYWLVGAGHVVGWATDSNRTIYQEIRSGKIERTLESIKGGLTQSPQCGNRIDGPDGRGETTTEKGTDP